jgi:two-component system phosphate regulon sensor histidine kinase PhoR
MLLPVLLSLIFTIILAIGLWLIIKNMLHHRNISQVQNDFINNMTHEFKTPIATISLASDSILNPSILHKHDKVSYFTGMIKKENKRMNRLVEKILQMARLENKEFKLEKQKVNVHEIIEMISENTKIKLNGKGDLKIQLNAGNHVVQADQVHITNVFYNLIDNAIKYSEEPVWIEIHTFNLKNQLFIRIKDSGQGINKKDIQHIFDRFYRVEAGNVHNTKGYGLGLTYVKAVIDKHHGQINVKSELGVGSTFEIRLPI